MKKSPSNKILLRLAVTRGRQKAWREKPDRMEAGRRKATIAARAKRQRTHEQLVDWLSGLPATMTTDQIVARISFYKHRPSSFFNRVRRHGLLSWDYATDTWVNHCHIFPVG